MLDEARTAFSAVHAVSITQKGLPPSFEDIQGDGGIERLQEAFQATKIPSPRVVGTGADLVGWRCAAPALHRALQEQDLVRVPMGMATGLASGLSPWQESLP